MRVTRIPGDSHDVGSRPCRVWLNDVEILNWTAADDFRRVVQTPDGARFGSVRIDMTPAAVAPTEEAATHLCGVFVAEPKPEAPSVEVVEAAPESAAPTKPVAPVLTQGLRGKGQK
jgi:hypothetical protein